MNNKLILDALLKEAATPSDFYEVKIGKSRGPNDNIGFKNTNLHWGGTLRGSNVQKPRVERDYLPGTDIKRTTFRDTDKNPAFLEASMQLNPNAVMETLKSKNQAPSHWYDVLNTSVGDKKVMDLLPGNDAAELLRSGKMTGATSAQLADILLQTPGGSQFLTEMQAKFPYTPADILRKMAGQRYMQSLAQGAAKSRTDAQTMVSELKPLADRINTPGLVSWFKRNTNKKNLLEKVQKLQAMREAGAYWLPDYTKASTLEQGQT